MLNFYRDVRKKLKKGVRDIGSGGKDIIRNNPEALIILATLGLTGAFPGGKEFGLPSFLGGPTSNGISKISQGSSKFGLDKLLNLGKEGTAGGGLGKLLQGILKSDKLLPFILAGIAKKQFEKEKEGPLDKSERLSEIDLKYGDITGGSPFAKDRFRGTQWDPDTGKYYDVKTFDPPAGIDEYANYEVDEEGRVVEQAQGGIAGLQAGGDPFMNRNRIRGSLGGGMNPRGRSPDPTARSITGYQGGGIPYIDPNRGTLGGGMPGRKDPTIEGIMGYNPLRQSNPRFITRANGGSTAGDLADVLEDNPGISQFFPRRFGAITGPGGPKEDKIPAMLSDGEFVMTSKAVDNAGGPKEMYNLMNRLDPESSQGRGIV